jgi:hypothetical protein
MAELEHIRSILKRAFRQLEKDWEEREEMSNLEEREIDASQEGQDSFDDI